jgi:hypothetical protein
VTGSQEADRQTPDVPPPFPFIVACGRSGTTLLRAILDSHPDMAVPPETKFIVSLLKRRRRLERDRRVLVEPFVAHVRWSFGLRDLGLSRTEAEAALDPPPSDTSEAIRRLFARYAARRGKSRYANKTPVHILSIPALAGAFPEARFIHVIRDGRDVALSYLDTDLGPDSLEAAAVRWRRWVGQGRRDGRRLGPGRYLELGYEHLVADPEGATKQVCRFLELAFDPVMLRYFERSEEVLVGIRKPQYFEAIHRPPTAGLRDWRRDMAPRDATVFALIAGDLLSELGYEVPGSRPRLPLRARARWRSLLAEAERVGDAAVRGVVRPVRRRIRRSRTLARADR